MSKTKPTIVQRLIGRLPDKMKRILFGVLVFQHCRDGHVTDEQWESFNQDLQLAVNHEALELPALWWKSFDVFDSNDRNLLMSAVMSAELSEQKASKLTNAVPAWLRYAQPEQMARDLEMIVRHCAHKA